MAKFIVPLFVTRESKIIGPFTFAQFVFVGIAGGICFLLFFLFGRKNIIAFSFIAIFLIGGALALAFLKVGGHPLPSAFKNFFSYILLPKIFLWQRKLIPPKVSKIKRFEKAKTEAETELKIVKESSLQKLFTQVETRKMK
jgi:membrane-bound ClpP family serine protease